ncbi:AI-2E family transporter [Actinoplanes auranticolor]|uniref:Uncharacterized protein n=1 Tax=Actinoplanes auranticolor TaxID=47988 RepID=A0A919SG32_9ACTN|nr:hypothetical protein [Actinoplanes auranticolor]GIM72045.1 hypothetical protein Aau02nite_49000 [Actinoplanes auranticolor]
MDGPRGGWRATPAPRRLKLPGWLAALTTVVALLIVVVGPPALITNQAVAQFADLEDQVVQGLDRIRQYLPAGPLTQTQLSSALDGLVETLRGAAPDPVSGAATAVQTLASDEPDTVAQVPPGNRASASPGKWRPGCRRRSEQLARWPGPAPS